MIGFFAGLLTGTVVAVVTLSLLHSGRHEEAAMQATSSEQSGLNSPEGEAAKLQKELERQFVQMMQYTGKEQRKKE